MSKDKDKIYIDSCCIIDIARRQKKQKIESSSDDDLDRIEILMRAAKNGDIDLYTSTLSIAECRHAKGTLDEDIKRLFNSILQSGKICILVDPHPFIMEDARDLYWKHGIEGLSGADSVHIATAIYHDCKEFLTVNKTLEKASELEKLGLKVIRPRDTLFLPEKYKQKQMGYENEEDEEE